MLPGQLQYPVTFEGAAGEGQLPEQPAHPKEEAVGGACGGQLAERFLHTMNMTSDGDHFSELETAAPPPRQHTNTLLWQRFESAKTGCISSTFAQNAFCLPRTLRDSVQGDGVLQRGEGVGAAG